MKKFVTIGLALTIIMCVGFVNTAQAQRHLYNRVELGGGNVWTFVGLEAVSMIINQITHRPITEATMRFCVPSSEYGNLNSYQGFVDWNYDRFSDDPEYGDGDNGYVKFSGKHLLSNIIVGDKIGYLSDKLGLANYCIYGAGYYNLQQLKLMSDYDDYTSLCTQRLQLGGGVMLILGSIESKGRVIIDGGLRYNLPLNFSGDGIEGSVNDIMNKGISSHYMFKYSWDNSVAIGLTVDMMHYDMFKDESLCGSQSKLFEFGITASILLRKY
ncbi:hypothetical protein [Parabacteroides goldsteinii]|uniref:hypothetical protein n=1 Tax=Parabacteroides goldsteinii TaxID=328812 RepID=UPI0032198605